MHRRYNINRYLNTFNCVVFLHRLLPSYIDGTTWWGLIFLFRVILYIVCWLFALVPIHKSFWLTDMRDFLSLVWLICHHCPFTLHWKWPIFSHWWLSDQMLDYFYSMKLLTSSIIAMERSPGLAVCCCCDRLGGMFVHSRCCLFWFLWRYCACIWW